MKWFLLAAAVVCHVAYADVTCKDGKQLCFECQGDDQAACDKRGSWTVCEGPGAVCEEVTSNGKHGFVVHFKRSCSTEKTCAAKSCQGVTCEGNNTIECKPCACDDSCPPNKPLYCYTCAHHTDSLCWISGRYELCEDHATCYHVQKPFNVRRGCMEKNKCAAKEKAGTLTCNVQPQEATPPEKSVSTCGIPDYCSCNCKGDPHCTTFDSKKIDNLPTGCWHTLARDGCVKKLPAVLPSFTISVKLTGAKATSISAIMIAFHKSIIILDRTLGAASVDGVPKTLPHSFITTANTTVTLYKKPGFQVAMIELPNRVVVEWNFEKEVTVHAPDTFREHMCGLCGDFNGNEMDDFSFGNPDKASRICPGKADDLDNVEGGETAVEGQEKLFLFSWTSKLALLDPVCRAECL